LYPLHNITRIIKSRMKCTGHEGWEIVQKFDWETWRKEVIRNT
jgi:hypothetical protein